MSARVAFCSGPGRRDSIGRVTAVETKPSSGGAVTVVAEGIAYEPFGPVNALNWQFGGHSTCISGDTVLNSL